MSQKSIWDKIEDKKGGGKKWEIRGVKVRNGKYNYWIIRANDQRFFMFKILIKSLHLSILLLVYIVIGMTRLCGRKWIGGRKSQSLLTTQSLDLTMISEFKTNQSLSAYLFACSNMVTLCMSVVIVNRVLSAPMPLNSGPRNIQSLPTFYTS